MDTHLLDDARHIAAMIGRRLYLRIPSVLAEGEPFNLRLSAVGADAIPLDHFRNVLRFENSVGVQGLPATFRFDPGCSTGVIEGLRAVGPDVVRIQARVEDPVDPEFPAFVVSNPAWVFPDPPFRIFWGDLHVHTKYSNCSGWRCLDPEWCYQYARDISLLDFCAPADHLRGIASDPSRWPRLQALARAYNDPGRFATFLAFESSHAHGYGGDNNAYYRDDDGPYFWKDREDMRGAKPEVHLQELWRQLDNNGHPYFTVPHHTGRAGKYRSWDEEYHDPEREPLFEIYSSWGSSEERWSRFPICRGNNDAPSYFVDALKAGARFGVIASSDDHATLPGATHNFRVAPYRDPEVHGFAHKGLAAVRASECHRDALFAAMRQRATYATTQARTLLDVQIGDAAMGQAIPADAALKKRREIRVRFTLHDINAATVTLLRNGTPLQSQSVRGPELETRINEIVFEDNEPLDAISLSDTNYRAEPFTVYYVRIQDVAMSHQWASPIWIDLA